MKCVFLSIPLFLMLFFSNMRQIPDEDGAVGTATDESFAVLRKRERRGPRSTPRSDFVAYGSCLHVPQQN